MAATSFRFDAVSPKKTKNQRNILTFPFDFFPAYKRWTDTYGMGEGQQFTKWCEKGHVNHTWIGMTRNIGNFVCIYVTSVKRSSNEDFVLANH